MTGLRAGRGIAGGAHGGTRTMMSDMWRFTGNFLSESAATMAKSASRLARLCLDIWRRLQAADRPAC